jgi:hypothetical protein
MNANVPNLECVQEKRKNIFDLLCFYLDGWSRQLSVENEDTTLNAISQHALARVGSVGCAQSTSAEKLIN